VVVAGAAGATPVGEAPVGAGLVGVIGGVVAADAPVVGEALADVPGVVVPGFGDDDDEVEPRDPV
jgi:hypothetical protein